MLANKPQEAASRDQRNREKRSPRTRLAPQWQRRWADMTIRIALLSMACGIAWYAMLTLVFPVPFLDSLTWRLRLLPGALAGLCAGAFTIWSRQRNAGRESVLDVILTYYLAVAVYILSGVPLVATFGRKDGLHLGLGESFLAAFGALYYAVIVATFLGVALIPLCWLTRHCIWRFRGPVAAQHGAAADDRPQAGDRG